jgi:hypothetical protein
VKRLSDLTVADLGASPVWRYEGGTGADTRVAPAQRESLSQLDDEIFLAATQFALADSTPHLGFCFPADDSGIDYLQPVILTASGPVSFWFDRPPDSQLLANQWRALGKEPDAIFPVSFRCLVPVDGRTVSGLVSGIETAADLDAGSPPDAASDDSGAAERRRGIGTGEKRTARRRKVEMTVEFSQDALEGTGVTGDVSRRGMFVRSTRLPGTGPALRLTVNLPDGRKLLLTGRVVRSSGSVPPSSGAHGFGLRLADEWPDYEELFSRRRHKPE